ncbi:MAG: DUF1573 domain-containing protein [Bacteroidota bacterium]
MKHLIGFLALSALLLAFQPTLAQDSEAVNVKKDLKKVLKELPADAQVQVLRYAERKRDALKAIEAKKAEQAASVEKMKNMDGQAVVKATEQKKAMPTPNKAIEVKPAPANTDLGIARPAPAKPVQPSFLQQAEEMDKTQVEWLEEKHVFGKIIEGNLAKHTFKFKNVGEQPLKLTRVKPSCGCTTPTYSKEEIAPGQEGFIEVSFNSRGRLGTQRKSITVTGNFEGLNKILRFEGEVVKE